MENMGADSLAENTSNAPEFICPNCLPKPKFLDFNEKRLHWASVVSVYYVLQWFQIFYEVAQFSYFLALTRNFPNFNSFWKISREIVILSRNSNTTPFYFWTHCTDKYHRLIGLFWVCAKVFHDSIQRCHLNCILTAMFSFCAVFLTDCCLRFTFFKEKKSCQKDN